LPAKGHTVKVCLRVVQRLAASMPRGQNIVGFICDSDLDDGLRLCDSPYARKARPEACSERISPMTDERRNQILAAALKGQKDTYARPQQVAAIRFILKDHGFDGAPLEAALLEIGPFVNTSQVLQDLKKMGVIKATLSASKQAAADALALALAES